MTNALCNEKINWNNEFNDIVSTTNYGIEMLVKNEKFSVTGIKKVVEHFEFVVIDEAHSLYTDATYADSPFHVQKFLEYIEKGYPNIKIILMTGTPEPIGEFLKKNHYEIIDKREECINVMPKRIEVISFKDAVQYMRTLSETEKTLYYSNSATGLVKGKRSILKKIIEKKESAVSNVTEEEIALCMGRDSISKLKEYRDDLEQECQGLKDYVIKNKKLPDNKKILLTTSTLKEGINILDASIKVAFCESHILSDIQQFAGRIRKGLDTLYIIGDNKQFIKKDDEIRQAEMELFFDISPGEALKNINSFYKNTVMDEKSILYNFSSYDNNLLEEYKLFAQEDFSAYHGAGQACKDYIDFVQKRNPYIRFNHLEDKFELYIGKFVEEKRLNNDFQGTLWKEQLKKFTSENGIEYACFDTEEDNIDYERLEKYIEEVKGKRYPNYDKGHNELLDTLREILLLNEKCKVNTIIKKLDILNISCSLKLVYVGRGKRGYELIRIA